MKWKIILFSLVVSFFLGCVSKNLDIHTSKIKDYKKLEYNRTLYVPYDKKSKQFVPILTNKKVVGFRLDNLQLVGFKKNYTNCSRGFGKDNCNHCSKFGPFYEPDLSRTAVPNFIINLFTGIISIGIMPLLAGFPTAYECKLNDKNTEYVIGNFLYKNHLDDDKRNKILFYYNKQYELANENKKYILKIIRLLNYDKDLLYTNNKFVVQNNFSCQINKCYNILLSNYKHTLASLKVNKNLFNYLKNNGVKINTLIYAKNLTNDKHLIKLINSKISQLQLLALKKQGESKFKKFSIKFSSVDIHNILNNYYSWAYLSASRDGFLIYGYKNTHRNGKYIGSYLTIIKLNKKGKVLWESTCGELAGGVVENNNKLYVTGYHKINVLNSKDGKIIKSFNIKNFIFQKIKKFATFNLKYFYAVDNDGYLIKIDNFLKLKKIKIINNINEMGMFHYLRDGVFIEIYGKKFNYINHYDLKGKILKTFSFKRGGNLGIPVIWNKNLSSNPLFVIDDFYYYVLMVNNNVIGHLYTPSTGTDFPIIYMVSKNEAFILGKKDITYVFFNNKKIIYYKTIHLPYYINSFSSYIDIKRNIIYALGDNRNKILCIHLK